MNGKDTTAEELIAALQKVPPKSIIRVAMTHDLDAEIATQGAIVGLLKPKKGLVILDCTDDCSHGFGKK